MPRRIHTIDLLIPYRTKPDFRTLRKRVNDAVAAAMLPKSMQSAWAYDKRQAMFTDTDDGAVKTSLKFEALVRAADGAELTRAVRREIDGMLAPAVEDIDGQTLTLDADIGTAIAIGDKVVITKPQEPTKLSVPDELPTEPVDAPVEAPPPPPPPPINIERGTFFDHIYDRDAQISILHTSIKAAVETDFQNRFHTILVGPPGCGKTEILRSVQRMLGEVHVLLLDGPGTTKAGAEQFLLNVERIQPFVLIEEIEKMHPAHMQWLLGLLDERGEVRRTNARDGHVQRDARVMCVATVNDLPRFRKLLHGALASRFSHEIYCPKPDVDVLHKIALREVNKVNGDPYWVNAAVNYCVHVEGTHDPRRIVSVCLSGRDALLDGTYQKALTYNRLLQQQANHLVEKK